MFCATKKKPIEFYRTNIRTIIDSILLNHDCGEFIDRKEYHFKSVTFCGQIQAVEFLKKDNKWRLEIEDGTAIITCYLPKVYKDSKDDQAAVSRKIVELKKHEFMKNRDNISAQNGLWLAEKIKVQDTNAAREFKMGMYIEINGAVKQTQHGKRRYINVLGYNFVDHDYFTFWKTRFS